MFDRLEHLKLALKGDVVTADHPEYADSIKRWARNATRQAKIVVFVKDAEDVSLALKFATSQRLRIAIRGGGHNPAGASSVEDGLVIDLSRHINGCRIDTDKKLAYVGGGALWETVDKKAIEYGLATVGGTVNHTGVGGLTLGGGYGWLSASHGLVIDNLVQVTMVVADGSILTVNETENADLFWGIRGSGCNFGVATEFVYKLHEQRRTVYSGPLIFPPHLLDAVTKVTVDWWKSNPGPKTSAMQVITRGPAPDFAPCIVLVPFYNGTEEEGRAEFKAFLDLKPMDLSGSIPYEKMNSLQNPNVGHGQNVYMKGISQMEYSPEIVKKVFDRMCEVSSKDFRVIVGFEFFPLDKINSVSNEAMAFNIRGPANGVLNICLWDDPSPESAKRGKDAAYAVADIIADAEKNPDESKTRAYANYDFTAGDDPEKARKMFGVNYPRLQQLKKKYDPDVIFNKWFTITPA